MLLEQRHPVERVMLVLGLSSAILAVAGCGALQKSENQPDQDPATKFKIGKPYHASYSAPGSAPFTKEDIYWDGKNCIRMEVSGSAMLPGVVTVLDMGKNESMAWQEGQNADHMYALTPTGPTNPLCILAKPNVKATASDSLGAKVINGHNCHGWKGQLNADSQMWLDDDTGAIVEMTDKMSTLTLTALDTSAQAPGVFQPPADYAMSSQPAGAGVGGHGRLHFGRHMQGLGRAFR